jgi:hypothetical protein
MPFALPIPFPTKAPVTVTLPSLSLSPCPNGPNVPFDLADGGPLADSPPHPSLPGELLRIWRGATDGREMRSRIARWAMYFN